MIKQGYVYIVGDQARGPLYVGVTSSLAERVTRHRDGGVQGLSKKYQLTRLVFFEHCDSIHRAIWRARQISHWTRASKLRLIEQTNPHWVDLYCRLSDKDYGLADYSASALDCHWPD
ncbi:MAG: putative endonuclease [Arenicella sp.]|jgi:putative endonuclease